MLTQPFPPMERQEQTSCVLCYLLKETAGDHVRQNSDGCLGCWLRDGEPSGGVPTRDEQDGRAIKSTEDLRNRSLTS